MAVGISQLCLLDAGGGGLGCYGLIELQGLPHVQGSGNRLLSKYTTSTVSQGVNGLCL